MSSAAADDWDQHWQDFTSSAEMGPAHEYRRRTVLQLLGIAGRGESTSLLEIGSGTGEFAEAFLNRYPQAQFLGLELSRVGVEISSRRVPAAKFVQRNLLLPAPAEQPPAPQSNRAVCVEVLEHLDDPVLLLRNASQYMASGCRMVVTVPGGPMSAFDRHIGHRRHYRPSDLKQLLEKAGFVVDAIYGIGFPFFNLYRLLIISRGDKLRGDISGTPSLPVRAGMFLFGILFKCNVMRGGWQTVAVAHWQ